MFSRVNKNVTIEIGKAPVNTLDGSALSRNVGSKIRKVITDKRAEKEAINVLERESVKVQQLGKPHRNIPGIFTTHLMTTIHNLIQHMLNTIRIWVTIIIVKEKYKLYVETIKQLHSLHFNTNFVAFVPIYIPTFEATI